MKPYLTLLLTLTLLLAPTANLKLINGEWFILCQTSYCQGQVYKESYISLYKFSKVKIEEFMVRLKERYGKATFRSVYPNLDPNLKIETYSTELGLLEFKGRTRQNLYITIYYPDVCNRIHLGY